MQFEDGNRQFGKCVEKTTRLVAGPEEAGTPLMSHRVLPELLPKVIEDAGGKPVYLVVIDNLRLDQWKVIEPMLKHDFRVESNGSYMSILPTATQYARNALFAGMLPSEIQRLHPEWWRNEDDEGSKNQFEGEMLKELVSRLGVDGKISYHKVTNLDAGKKLLDTFHETKGEVLTTWFTTS